MAMKYILLSIKNNEHCGYITEALFNLLMEQDPEEKENRALIHRAFGVDDEEKEEETLIFGKKIILDVSSTKDINDFEKIILSPVTYTKGAKPLTIKNCSEVKKVFQLIGVNACYTSFDNVYVGDTETGGFGFLKIGDKGDSPDSSILNTFKNVNIYMEGADTFIVKGGNALSFTSCDFNGNTYIETNSSNTSIFYKVSGVNSKFTNSSLRFSSNDGYETAINNSEIEGNFVCDSVKEIASSYLENVKLESLDRVDSCYLSAYIYENDGKRSSLINVNSNEEKILPKDTQVEIL